MHESDQIRKALTLHTVISGLSHTRRRFIQLEPVWAKQKDGHMYLRVRETGARGPLAVPGGTG